MSEPTKPIGIVDANNQFAKCWHAAEQPRRAFLAQCHRWQGDFAQTLLCWDAPPPTWRSAIYEQYKSGRHGSTEEDRAKREAYRDALRAAQDAFGGLYAPEHEADDVIAALAAREVQAGQRVCIVSSDKDMWQLLEPGVLTCRTQDTVHGARYMTAKRLIDTYGVEPGQWRDYLALVGDTSDSIPGCPGLGPKRAQKLLEQHGSIDGIYQAIAESRARATPRLVKVLQEHKSSGGLDLHRRLVTLRPPSENQLRRAGE